MSRPFKLYRLQQIDSQLDWMKARLKEIEIAMSNDEEIRKAGLSAEKASEDLITCQGALHKAEDEVKAQRVKIEQTEATLYGGKVHNPKELTDMQNDVAALKRYLGVLEDRQLEAMMAEEEADAIHKTSRQDLEATQQQFATMTAGLQQEKDKALNDVARFQGERQAVLGTIEPEDLKLYSSLREKRHGIAVAKVADRACSACGSTLAAVLLHAAHSPNEINRCENCGRILYLG